jgi:hypothetical protein
MSSSHHPQPHHDADGKLTPRSLHAARVEGGKHAAASEARDEHGRFVGHEEAAAAAPAQAHAGKAGGGAHKRESEEEAEARRLHEARVHAGEASAASQVRDSHGHFAGHGDAGGKK